MKRRYVLHCRTRTLHPRSVTVVSLQCNYHGVDAALVTFRQHHQRCHQADIAHTRTSQVAYVGLRSPLLHSLYASSSDGSGSKIQNVISMLRKLILAAVCTSSQHGYTSFNYEMLVVSKTVVQHAHCSRLPSPCLGKSAMRWWDCNEQGSARATSRSCRKRNYSYWFTSQNKALLYRPKPIHCNYHVGHYSGFCRISPSILNRFTPNVQA